jgi:hypothetical protein
VTWHGATPIWGLAGEARQIDPEIGMSIIQLGLVRDKIGDGIAHFMMILTPLPLTGRYDGNDGKRLEALSPHRGDAAGRGILG